MPLVFFRKRRFSYMGAACHHPRPLSQSEREKSIALPWTPFLLQRGEEVLHIPEHVLVYRIHFGLDSIQARKRLRVLDVQLNV